MLLSFAGNIFHIQGFSERLDQLIPAPRTKALTRCNVWENCYQTALPLMAKSEQVCQRNTELHILCFWGSHWGGQQSKSFSACRQYTWNIKAISPPAALDLAPFYSLLSISSFTSFFFCLSISTAFLSVSLLAARVFCVDNEARSCLSHGF